MFKLSDIQMSKLRRSSAKIGASGLGWKHVSIKLNSTGGLFVFAEVSLSSVVLEHSNFKLHRRAA